MIPIGPCNGIRLPFDSSVFNITPLSVVAENHCCKPTTRRLYDAHRRDIGEEPYTLQNHHADGSGQQLCSYRPANGPMKAELIKWMTLSMPFNGYTFWDDDDMWDKFDKWLGSRDGKEAICHLSRVDRKAGEDTWYWPKFPTCKCKPASIFHFEGVTQNFSQGSHIPIIVYIGNSKDKAHSLEGSMRRNEKAKNRGIGCDKKSRDEREHQQQNR